MRSPSSITAGSSRAGTADELKSQVGGERIEVVVRDRALLARAAAIIAGDGSASVDEHTRRVTIAADGGAQQLVEVVRRLGDESIQVDDVGLRRPTLDDVFLSLTGHGAEAEPSHDEEPAPKKGKGR